MLFNLVRWRWSWLSLVCLACACGDVKETPDAAVQDDAAVADAPGTFTVGGTVTGFAGRGLTLQLNGVEDLAITADGAFNFPTGLATNTPYTVAITSEPICPQRVCTIANATGTIAGTDATTVTVTCAGPRYRLGSQNWGEQSIRVTDDVQALSNNGTAAPRIITGAQTGLNSSEVDGLAFDTERDLIYAAGRNTTANTFGISVFTSASSAAGNVAPARRILVAGETTYNGIELDAAANRLYAAAGSGRLYIFDNASTVDGTVIPTHAITVANPVAVTLDRLNDRLYVSDNALRIHIFDAAQQLTSASVPTRTVTWMNTNFPRTLAIDACRDRLYIGIRNVSPTGFNFYVFDAASTLTGAVDIETATAARLTVSPAQVMSSALDSSGALYYWNDSATAVRIVNAPHTFTGAVTVVPDKTVSGVVSSGYGLDVVAY